MVRSSMHYVNGLETVIKLCIKLIFPRLISHRYEGQIFPLKCVPFQPYVGGDEVIYLPSVDKPGLEVNFATSTILTANCWLVVLWIHLRTMLNGPLEYNQNTYHCIYMWQKLSKLSLDFTYNEYDHWMVLVYTWIGFIVICPGIVSKSTYIECFNCFFPCKRSGCSL